MFRYIFKKTRKSIDALPVWWSSASTHHHREQQQRRSPSDYHRDRDRDPRRCFSRSRNHHLRQQQHHLKIQQLVKNRVHVTAAVAAVGKYRRLRQSRLQLLAVWRWRRKAFPYSRREEEETDEDLAGEAMSWKKETSRLLFFFLVVSSSLFLLPLSRRVFSFFLFLYDDDFFVIGQRLISSFVKTSSYLVGILHHRCWYNGLMMGFHLATPFNKLFLRKSHIMSYDPPSIWQTSFHIFCI